MTFNFNDAIDKRLKKQKLVEETLSELLGLKVLKEAVARKTDPISLKTISTIRPEDKTELEIFLNNIQGNNLRTKVANINAFFSKFMKEGFSAEDPTLFENKTNSQALQETISYLVFYKTLTSMIDSLDASSAGYSFESFLSVLIGGQVLPSKKGNAIKTLVDIVGTNEGDISAKFLTKGGKISGAYSNLLSDMVNGREVKYIVGLKDIDKESGQGKLSFTEFVLNRENFISVLASTSPPSSLKGIQIRLSDEFPTDKALEWEEVEAKFKRDLAGSLSMKDGLQGDDRLRVADLVGNMIFREKELRFFNRSDFKYDEESYQDFLDNFEDYYEESVELAKSDPKLSKKYGNLNFQTRDESGNYSNNYKIIIKNIKGLKSLITKKKAGAEKTEISNAYSLEDSIELYGKANTDEERIDLIKRMLSIGEFSINYNYLVSSGKGSVSIYEETIDFGQAKLEALVSNLSNVTKVTGLRIIEDAQGMLEDLNKYFAGGLENSELADSARTKARRIDRKTKQISTKES